ncbi:MAG: DUF11 domain-containing protein [Anaerolineales bacterium]|nr:DUF11 domain-containing protein [Anaerolineales bacterium]
MTAGSATVTAALTGYQNVTATPVILDIGPTTQNLALGTADLVIMKSDGKTEAQPGEILDYVLTVVNQGSILATGITVTDTFPSYLTYVDDDATVTPSHPTAAVYVWALGDLAAGASLSFTLRAQVASALPDGVTAVSNYANLSATSPDRDRTNNEVSDVDTVTAHPDLTLAKTFRNHAARRYGSTVTYELSGAILDTPRPPRSSSPTLLICGHSTLAGLPGSRSTGGCRQRSPLSLSRIS